MSTVYPGNIDTFPTVSPGDLIQSQTDNNEGAAIVAIETVLGTNPNGSFATVAEALVAGGNSSLFLAKNFT